MRLKPLGTRCFSARRPGSVSKEALQGTDPQGNTALHYAAANGRSDLVELIAASNRKIVKALNQNRESAMSAAAKRGRTACVASLLAQKANFEDEESILFDATDLGHIDVVRLLAASKARSSALKSRYSWALSLAINENFEDQAIFLMDQGATFSLSGKVTAEQLVLSKFANGYPDMGFRIMEIRKVKPSISERGFNLFHAVASYADNALLDRLLAAGCDLAQKSETGLMPMDVAVGLGNVEAICWFIDNGGRNKGGDGQVDPVFRAIDAGREDSVQCLINYGYDINREVAAGVTPIMFAVAKGETDIARSILQAGGAWLIDSPYMELAIARILRLDAADLLDAALDQGWELSRGISNALSLAEAAAFYEAAACQKLLAEKGIDISVEVPPASALAATPRVLTPLEVDYPVDLQRKFGEREVYCDIAISSAGAPTLVRFDQGLEPQIADLLERAIYKLQFEPALREGEPTAAALRMKTTLRVDMSSEKVFDMSEVSERPKALQMARAIYPFALQKSRVKGEVVVEFIIRATGEISNVRVVRSTESGFDASAMASVTQSTWRPATLNGKPVDCRVRLPIVFTP